MVVLGCCVRVCCEKASNVTKKVEGRVSVDTVAKSSSTIYIVRGSLNHGPFSYSKKSSRTVNLKLWKYRNFKSELQDLKTSIDHPNKVTAVYLQAESRLQFLPKVRSKITKLEFWVFIGKIANCGHLENPKTSQDIFELWQFVKPLLTLTGHGELIQKFFWNFSGSS